LELLSGSIALQMSKTIDVSLKTTKISIETKLTK